MAYKYSEYDKAVCLSGHGYIDGIPMMLSDKLEPPPRVKLPRVPDPSNMFDLLETEYDFSLERGILAKAEAQALAELVARHASEVDSAMEELARSETPVQVVAELPKTKKDDDNRTWTLGSAIMTPTPLVAAEITKAPEAVKFHVKDFETVDDPFDDLELKVLDDMAELKSVLDVVQQSTSPLLDTGQDKNDEQDVSSQSTNVDRKSSSSPRAYEVNDRNNVETVLPNALASTSSMHSVNSFNSVHNGPMPNSYGRLSRNTSSSYVIKSRPVNLDDYDISLPNTDHLNPSFSDRMTVSATNGITKSDFGQFANESGVASVAMTNCNPYRTYNGGGAFPTGNPYCANNSLETSQIYDMHPTTQFTYNHLRSVGGVHHDEHYTTRPVIGAEAKPLNTKLPVIPTASVGANKLIGVKSNPSTFDEYRYSGYKLRSARSTSDLCKLNTDDDSVSYRVSHSPPPRLPPIQTRASGGRYSLASQHTGQQTMNSSTNQRASPSTLTDPFTSLNSEEQDYVAMFVDMGFPRARAARAVNLFGKDAKQVTDYLCLCDGLVEQGYPADDVEVASQLADNQIKLTKEYLAVMRQMNEFGFQRAQITEALRLHQTDREKCLDYLTTS